MAFETGFHPVTQCVSQAGLEAMEILLSSGVLGMHHRQQLSTPLFYKEGMHGWPALRCCFLCLPTYPETYLATVSLLFLLLGSIRTHECPTVSCLAHLDTELISGPFPYKHPSLFLPVGHACKEAGGINS